MSAPPPRDPHAARAQAELAELREQAEIEALFAGVMASAKVDRVVADWKRKQPYERLDRPSWCLFTDEQWENYDAWNALWDKQERKYGRLLPRAAAMMRSNRGVW